MTSVTQLINTLDVSDGGPARNSYELNLALNGLPGVSARLVWISGLRERSVIAASEDVLPRRVPSRAFRGSVPFRSVLREISQGDALIVHGYYLWWVPLAAALAAARRIPLFLVPHGTFTRHQRSFSRAKKRVFDIAFGRFVQRQVRFFVVGSERERVELLQALPSAQVVVGGAGTRMSALPRGSSWGIPPRLLTLGRVAQKKRVDVSISAVSELARRGVKVRLAIAGDGDPALLAELRLLAARLGVESHVEFVGRVAAQAKTDQFAMADIFILPSDDENFGIAVAEALASGLPVIVSPSVAAAEELPAEAGGIVEPTPEAIADEIERLLESDRGAARSSALSFAERYSWPAVAQRWGELLADVGTTDGLPATS